MRKLILLGFVLLSSSAALANCTDLSGHYRLESGDVHDITYDTTIVQTGCSEIHFAFVDGTGEFSMSSDWKTDGKTYSEGPDSSAQAGWDGAVVSSTLKSIDPVYNESTFERISYKRLSPLEIKRTLDLINPDQTRDHFEETYKKISP